MEGNFLLLLDNTSTIFMGSQYLYISTFIPKVRRNLGKYKNFTSKFLFTSCRGLYKAPTLWVLCIQLLHGRYILSLPKTKIILWILDQTLREKSCEPSTSVSTMPLPSTTFCTHIEIKRIDKLSLHIKNRISYC